jgi:TatA/E family protein of Tat protein translocase
MSDRLLIEFVGIVAGTEWIVIIAVIGVLIFGAKKFPELARSFGRATSVDALLILDKRQCDDIRTDLSKGNIFANR